MFSSFPHRHGDATGKPATRDKTRGCRKNSMSYETSSNLEILWTSSNRLECHKVSRLLLRKTTWQPAWTHSNRRGFPASPIDTATPQENQRLETRHVDARGCRKNSMSYETSSNLEILWTSSNRLECHKVPRLPRKMTWQLAWKRSKRRGFAASPIDTAKPQENQRLETRHVGAPKRAFRARRPPIFTLWNMPKRHVLQPPPWTRPKCCACHENCNTSSENVTKVLRLPRRTTFDTFQNTSECHKVPRLPRETKQRHVCNPQKGPPLQNFP